MIVRTEYHTLVINTPMGLEVTLYLFRQFPFLSLDRNKSKLIVIIALFSDYAKVLWLTLLIETILYPLLCLMVNFHDLNTKHNNCVDNNIINVLY